MHLLRSPLAFARHCGASIARTMVHLCRLPGYIAHIADNSAVIRDRVDQDHVLISRTNDRVHDVSKRLNALYTLVERDIVRMDQRLSHVGVLVRQFRVIEDMRAKLGSMERILYLAHFQRGDIGLDQIIHKYPGFLENPLSLYHHCYDNGYLNSSWSREKVVIFLHICKAGGSTVTDVIRRNIRSIGFREDFQKNANIHADKILTMFRGLSEEMKELERAKWDQYDVLANHSHYGVHELLSRPYAYITMLRDPIDRALSYYRFLQALPEVAWTGKATDSGRAKSLSFTEFLSDTHFQEKYESLCMTKIIAGVLEGDVNEEMYALAKEHLSTFEAVMIMERFDESMQLLQALYGWKDEILVEGEPRPRGDQVTGMVTKSANARSQLSPEEVAAAEEYLHYDVKLYEYGKALFEKQLQKHGVTERIAAKKAELVKDSLVA